MQRHTLVTIFAIVLFTLAGCQTHDVQKKAQPSYQALHSRSETMQTVHFHFLLKTDNPSPSSI